MNENQLDTNKSGEFFDDSLNSQRHTNLSESLAQNYEFLIQTGILSDEVLFPFTIFLNIL
jgi:hypothetical protein